MTKARDRAGRFTAFSPAAARETLIKDLYGDAQRFRRRAWSKYTQVVSGPAGSEFVTMNLPPLRDQQAAYAALGLCVDKAARMEDRGDNGQRTVISLLGALFDDLHAKHSDGGTDLT